MASYQSRYEPHVNLFLASRIGQPGTARPGTRVRRKAAVDRIHSHSRSEEELRTAVNMLYGTTMGHEVRRTGVAAPETGRHNTAEEGISQQGANTAEAAQQELARHDPVTEAAEGERLKNEAANTANTAKYETGELANRNSQRGLDKQKFEASVSTLPDLRSLDAEEKLDNQAWE
jgi:hypothetical protein